MIPVRQLEPGHLVIVEPHVKRSKAVHVVTAGAREHRSADGFLLLRIRVCYCGSTRWYAPVWISAHLVGDGLSGADPQRVDRARKLLSAIDPDPDGFIRMSAGRRQGEQHVVVVGHVDLPRRWCEVAP